MPDTMKMLPLTFGVEIEVLFAMNYDMIQSCYPLTPLLTLLRENHRPDPRDRLVDIITDFDERMLQAAGILRKRGLDFVLHHPSDDTPENDLDFFNDWRLTSEIAVPSPESNKQIARWSNYRILDLEGWLFTGLELISRILDAPNPQASNGYLPIRPFNLWATPRQQASMSTSVFNLLQRVKWQSHYMCFDVWHGSSLPLKIPSHYFTTLSAMGITVQRPNVMPSPTVVDMLVAWVILPTSVSHSILSRHLCGFSTSTLPVRSKVSKNLGALCVGHEAGQETLLITVLSLSTSPILSHRIHGLQRPPSNLGSIMALWTRRTSMSGSSLSRRWSERQSVKHTKPRLRVHKFRNSLAHCMAQLLVTCLE